MGLCNSPDIFQEKMNELYNDLEYVRSYIDDLLLKKDHLNTVKIVLNKHKEAGIKINAE